jgi:hypothetical protein
MQYLSDCDHPTESLLIMRDQASRASGIHFHYTDGAHASATKFGDDFRRGHNLW